MEKKREKLIKLLSELDEEAFSYVVLSLLPSAMFHGVRTQVWPDGIGGFIDKMTINAIRKEAKKYTGIK